MPKDEILAQFPEQVESGKVFIINITTKDNIRYTLHIAQQITPRANLAFNEAQMILKIGFHHGVTKARIDDFNLVPGYTFNPEWNLSVIHKFSPQYPTQAHRLDREGNPLLCDGCVYYEHVSLVYGPLVYLPFKSDKLPITANTTVEKMDF